MPIFKYWRTTTALTANEAIGNAGRVFKANATAGAQTHAIVAPGTDGRELYVVKTDSSSNTVTLTLNLDGSAQSIVLAYKGDAVKLYDDGTTWTVLGNRPSAAALSTTYATKVDIRPEDFGAVGDGTTDDGAAFSAAIAAASALAAGNSTGQVTVRAKPGATYRIKTSIVMRSFVTLDLRGVQMKGPITGSGYIDASTSTAVPAATDKVAQIAGACITDDGSSVVSFARVIGGTISGFRYGVCTASSAWAYPTLNDVTFVDCNIGFFAYQGCQEPRIINTRSAGGAAGVTFVAAATCFAAGHPNASSDNFFCDGLIYDNAAPERDKSVTNPGFDTWFQQSILRPSTASVVINGTFTFNLASSSGLNVSGRNIYVPSRNRRLVFSPQVRRAHGVDCGRGMIVIGNPITGRFDNIAGEGIFASAPDSMLLVLLSNGYPCDATVSNLDSVFSTNPAKAAIEVVRLVGTEPDASIEVRDVSGMLLGGVGHFQPPLNLAAAPTVSGTPTVGNTLSATTGAYVPTPTTYSYQWQRNGSNISGATSATYTLVSGDSGTNVGVVVLAARTDRKTYAAYSSTVPVAAAPTPALTNTAAPTISGTPTVGNTLTTSNGSWSATPDSYTYQWRRAGTPISGVTASTYMVVSADIGQAITVIVTAAKAGYTSGSSTSGAVAGAAAPAVDGALLTESGDYYTTESGDYLLAS